MRKIFVKTTNNEFEEVYLKSVRLGLTIGESAVIDTIKSEIYGNFKFCTRYIYDSEENVRLNKLTPVSSMFPIITGFIETHDNISFHRGNGSTYVDIFFWGGNCVREDCASGINNYISHYIYDCETDKCQAMWSSGTYIKDGKTFEAAKALANNERSFVFEGRRYFFSKEECANSSESKIIIHRLDDKQAKSEELKQDIIHRLNDVVKGINTEINNISNGKKLIENSLDGLEAVLTTLEGIKTELKK